MYVLHCLRSVHKWQCSSYTVHVTKWWMCDVCTDFYMCIGVACTHTWGWQVAVDCWTVMMCSVITLANPCGLNGSCVSRTKSLPVEGSYMEPWHPSLYTADDNLTASFTIPKRIYLGIVPGNVHNWHLHVACIIGLPVRFLSGHCCSLCSSARFFTLLMLVLVSFTPLIMLTSV